ncbi:lamin tail domain-containing protein [Streptomyces sp. NPDC046197]|uniref:lamin tail domain-containing protein n=1 Tax=Streptomyces sp. NPDC046197 TaxID=3154337 RepID=UPI00340F1D3A
MSVSVSVNARRLAAAAVAAGALVGTAVLPASAADHDRRSHRQDVVISSVHPDSPDRDRRTNRSLNREWVDITNKGLRSVNLDGWTLSDASGHTYTFRHYRLEGRSTVRVHSGFGRDTATDLYQDRRTPVWDRRSDTATLRNDHDRFVDAVSWDDRRNRDGRNDRDLRDRGIDRRDGHGEHDWRDGRH